MGAFGERLLEGAARDQPAHMCRVIEDIGADFVGDLANATDIVGEQAHAAGDDDEPRPDALGGIA